MASARIGARAVVRPRRRPSRAPACRSRRRAGLRTSGQAPERCDPILPGGLRRIQRLVARAQQRRRLGAVERVGRDAGGDAQREARVRQTLGEQRADLTAERLRGVRAGSGSMTTNSSPPMPRGLRALRQRTHEDVRDLAEQGVAELVACAVVDLLEVVAVDDEKAQSARRCSCASSSASSSRSSSPRRFRIRVSGSVAALRRSRWRANAASSEAATCAARTAAVSRTSGPRARRPGDADERADAPQRSRAAAARRRTPQRACRSRSRDRGRDRRRSGRSACVPPRVAARRAAAATPRRRARRRARRAAPSSSQTTSWLVCTGSTFGSDAAPSAAMSRGSRRLPRCTNRRARAARSSVLLARSSSANGRERAGQRSERLGRAVRQRALGFDVEDADDRCLRSAAEPRARRGRPGSAAT